MNETNYTYNGVTVEFTEAQKAILLADQNLITQLNNQKIDLQQQYVVQEEIINNAKNQLDNYCNTLSGFGGSSSPRQKCIDANNAAWNNARAKATSIANALNTLEGQISSAIKKLNDDLIVIQNDIKLQIQAQQANIEAGNAPANAAAANEQALQELKNQAESAKLKQEQTIRIFGYGLLTIVVIVIAVLVIRKIS